MRPTTFCVVAALCIGGGLHAVQDPQPPPRFRTGVDVVVLDVTVLDRGRSPVRGLTAGDFTVLEEGAPRPIVSFDEMAAAEPDAAAVPWMREVAPDVRTNNTENRRIVLIVLDSAGASFRHTAAVKKIGHAVVDRLGPTDLATVLFTGGDRDAQDFTGDRAALRRAIDRFTDVSMPPALTKPYRIRTVSRAAEYMIAVPHRRKAMIYVGAGGLGLYGDGAGAVVTEIGASSAHAPASRSFEMQDLLLRAQRANVSIYTVNPAGLEVRLEGGFDDTVDSLQTLSNATGGFAVVNTNTFDAQIAQIFRETGSYYLIGFEAAPSDGKFRRLDVKVNRPGMIVRTRTGYQAAKPEKQGPARPGDVPRPLLEAMSGILPEAEFPIRVTVAPFAVPGKNMGAVIIALGLRQPAPDDGAPVVEHVELMTSAFTNRGQPRGSRRQTARLVLRPVEIGEAKYEILSRLDLRPGRYNLRLAVHSSSLGKTGSVYHEVEIPDFARLPLSLSGVLIGATPGLPSAPRDLLPSLVPTVPTTERDFSASDEVTAFLRAYQGGRKAPLPVTLDVRVVNDRDEPVHSATYVLAPESFGAGRSADVRVDLPMDRFAAGPYLLTFEARLELETGAQRHTDATARRDVRFVVR